MSWKTCFLIISLMAIRLQSLGASHIEFNDLIEETSTQEAEAHTSVYQGLPDHEVIQTNNQDWSALRRAQDPRALAARPQVKLAKRP